MIAAVSISVALAPCRSYRAEELKTALDQVLREGGLVIRPGYVVLLKPNLVSAGGGSAHLACTSPALVAAVAEWCLDQGARVRVGDSPAFGSGRSVMRACGSSRSDPGRRLPAPGRPDFPGLNPFSALQGGSENLS